MSMSGVVTAALTISKTETGLNAHVVAEVPNMADPTAGTLKTEMYLIDGYSYVYDKDTEAYYKSKLETADSSETSMIYQQILGSLPEDFDLSQLGGGDCGIGKQLRYGDERFRRSEGCLRRKGYA